MSNKFYKWFDISWRNFGLGVHVWVGKAGAWEVAIDLGPISAGISW